MNYVIKRPLKKLACMPSTVKCSPHTEYANSKVLQWHYPSSNELSKCSTLLKAKGAE
jgi:hypothetical protein